MNNLCTLYIVRHGETDWNAKNRIQGGQSDIPLNKMGEIQAGVLAKELKDIHFDKVVSSDLIRAKRTAEIIVLEKKLAIETTAVLRERRFGVIEGKDRSVFHAFDELLNNLEEKERNSYKLNPGYDSNDEFWQRFIPYLKELSVAYPGKTILVVSHGGILRSLLDRLSEKFNPNRTIKNGGYLIIESDGVDLKIKGANGVDL